MKKILDLLLKISGHLLNPIVAGSVALVLFFIGFVAGVWNVAGGLWSGGYFNPEAYTVAKVEHRHTPLETSRAELARLEKLAIELDRTGSDLNKRSQELDGREKRLLKTENELRLEKDAIQKLSQHIEVMRKELDEKIVMIELAQEANTQQLSKLYSVMSPDSASKILFTMPDPQAVQVIRKMKEDKSAKIFEAWIKAGGASAEKANRVAALMRVVTQAAARETP